MKNSSTSSEDLTLQLFITFLERNDAYSSFFLNSSKNPPHLDISFLKNVRPDTYISAAFPWASTPEGTDYWQSISDKWNLILNLFKL